MSKLPRTHAKPLSATQVAAQIHQIEDLWMADRIDGRTASTDAIVADDYEGTTSFGSTHNKSDFIKSIEHDVTGHGAHSLTDRKVRVSGDIAISTGISATSSSDRRHSYRFLRVFEKRAGEWRLIASQSTKVAK
jgi:ketosteroid isomerase-like protein